MDMFKFWVVLYEYEQGVILRLGKVNRDLGSGIHWRAPFRIEELRFVNIRQQTSNSWDMTFPLNGSSITMSFAAVIAVSNARKVLMELNNWTSASYTITKIAIAERVNELLEADHDCYTRQTTFTADVKKHVTKRLDEIGVELKGFAFQEIAKTRAYKFFGGPAR